MKYEVHTVEQGELPAGHHAVIVEREGAEPLLLLSGAPARTWALLRAYEDTLEPCTLPSILEPLRLVV